MASNLVRNLHSFLINLPLIVLFFFGALACGGGGGGTDPGNLPPLIGGDCVCDADCGNPNVFCNPITGVCTEKQCSLDTDCPATPDNEIQVCARNDCVVSQCETDGDCPGPQICTAFQQCRLEAFGPCPSPTKQTNIDGQCRIDQSECGGIACGDGVLEGNEECDDGGANSDSDPDACRTDCTLPSCGDGVVDPGNNEACESDADCPNGSCDPPTGGNPCQCMEPVGDRDGDGVADEDDNCPDTPNADQADFDGSGGGDACDDDDDNDQLFDVDEGPGTEDPVYACATDPLDADTDNDSISDGDERTAGLNPCSADTDTDGVNDPDDPFPTDPNESGDSDGDGVGNNSDNCASLPNPGQEDADSDGRGDICDNCVDDANNADPDVQTNDDGDALGNACDNCPGFPNDDQADADGDGNGDACDQCAGGDDNVDSDGDGTPDGCDFCPDDPDNDIDGDQVCGDQDNCPIDFNPGQEDDDGNGIGNVCDQLAGGICDLAGPCSNDDSQCPNGTVCMANFDLCLPEIACDPASPNADFSCVFNCEQDCPEHNCQSGTCFCLEASPTCVDNGDGTGTCR